MYELDKYWDSKDLAPKVIREHIIVLTLEALKKNPQQSTNHLTSAEVAELRKRS